MPRVAARGPIGGRGESIPRAQARDLPPHLLRGGHDRLGDPALHARRPGRGAALAHARAARRSTAALSGYYTQAFGFDVPLWKQYLNFWAALFHGDLGRSITNFPTPVSELIMGALPYTLALLVPAIVLSFWAGNKVGALAARRKVLDNTVLPASYVLTATPQMWLGIVLAWLFASTWAIFPVSGAYGLDIQPSWSLEFALSFLYHWILPFSALFLVAFGGWAIGMRNMIIYELESDYSNYLAALGAPTKLVRKYAYRNALLPQITGLALALGAVVAGAIVVEIVFSYPGLGTLTLNAIQNRDYFLIQGIFLFLIIGVLIANFVIDIVYVVIDPRTRIGMQGELMPLTEPTQSGVALPAGPEADVAAPAAPALPSGTGAPPRARSEFLYFAFRNWKFVFGATIVLAMLAIAIVGPMAGRPSSARVRRAARPAPVLRVLARYDVVRAGRLLAVRPRSPRRLPRGRPRRRHRLGPRRRRSGSRRATAAAGSTTS